MLTRDVKPVIVSMGDVAASGGYYMAVPAHTIVAQPGTITGSIGVVTGKFVLQGGAGQDRRRHGPRSDGRLAEIYSPFRPFSADERARIEEQMQATYELFLSRVAEGRKQPATRIDAVAQGRVWTGRQARERGLVDELGGLDGALRIAKQRAQARSHEGGRPGGLSAEAVDLRHAGQPVRRAAEAAVGLRTSSPGAPRPPCSAGQKSG